MEVCEPCLLVWCNNWLIVSSTSLIKIIQLIKTLQVKFCCFQHFLIWICDLWLNFFMEIGILLHQPHFMWTWNIFICKQLELLLFIIGLTWLHAFLIKKYICLSIQNILEKGFCFCFYFILFVCLFACFVFVFWSVIFVLFTNLLFWHVYIHVLQISAAKLISYFGVWNIFSDWTNIIRTLNIT